MVGTIFTDHISDRMQHTEQDSNNMKLKYRISNNHKIMSAQVTPLSPIEGVTANGNRSSELPMPSNNVSGNIPYSKKHFCS